MKKKYYWLIGILGLTTLAIMILFRILQISEPLNIGFNLFLDVCISLLLAGIIMGIILTKKNRKEMI